MPKNKILSENLKDLFSVLGIFVIWRAILQLIAFLGKNRFSLNPDPARASIQPWEAPIHSFFQFLARWDSGFYLDIAQSGYFWDTSKKLFNTPFFPLYPFLIRNLNFLFEGNNFYTGIFISTIASLIACFYLYKLAKLDLEKRDAFRSIFYFLIFPTAIFLAAIYTESLFCMLSIACFYYARKNKWAIAGIFGFFTALTRPQGIILFPILLLEYLEQKGFKFKKIRFNLLWTLLIPAGIGIYMFFLNIKFKNPLLFILAQNSWRKSENVSFSSIWHTLTNYVHDFFFPGNNLAYYIVKDFDLIFFLSFLILSVIIFFRLRMSYGFYIFLSLILPLTTNTLESMNRYTILLFPAFIFLAKISKNQIVQYGITLLFASLFTIYTILFINWYWAG
jgi:Gpi18-like mannosyltransferase